MSQPFILAVDLGTQSVRAAAIDADGKILALLPMNLKTAVELSLPSGELKT
jgi:sugar (pentulose or hexulose) kinase